jgi:chromosome segregation ATPase
MPAEDHTAAIFESLGELKGTSAQILHSLDEVRLAHTQSAAEIHRQSAEMGIVKNRLDGVEESVDELQNRAGTTLRDRIAFIGGVGGPAAVISAIVTGHFWH